MNIFLVWGIIILLLIIILILSIALFVIIKKATYLSRKEKDFINFSIDMYIDYAKNLDIHSEEQHDLIVKELKKIKSKSINYEK